MFLMLLLGRRGKLRKLAHRLGHRRSSDYKIDQEKDPSPPQPYLRLLDGKGSLICVTSAFCVLCGMAVVLHICLQMMNCKMRVAHT